MQNQNWNAQNIQNNQNVQNMENTQPWQQQKPIQQAMNQPLSEQETSFDLLYQEKELMNCLTACMEEVSHKALRQVMQDAFREIEQDQLSTFAVMQQQGWYQVKPAQAQDVQTAKQKFQQMRTTL